MATRQTFFLLAAVVLLGAALMSAGLVSNHEIFAKKKKNADNKARDDIVKKLGQKTEGKFSKIVILNISMASNPKSVINVINKTTPTPPPVPVCKPDEVLVNGVCQPKPGPAPNPMNRSGVTIFTFIGDFALGGSQPSKVHNALKKQNADQNFLLGDLGYKATLDEFIAEYLDLKLGDFNVQQTWLNSTSKCIPGNHDQMEDGNANIAAQSTKRCGDFWYYKNVKAQTLVIAFNSNAKADKITSFVTSVVNNPSIMDGVRTIDVISHKACFDFPGAHHGVESAVKGICDAIVAALPKSNMNVYFIAAHDHDLAATQPKRVGSYEFQALIGGGGGKTKYHPCGTNGDWVFCNDVSDGYVRQIINNTSGKALNQIVDISGNILFPKP